MVCLVKTGQEMENADLVFATISVIKVPLIKVHELLLKYLLLQTERLYRLLMVLCIAYGVIVHVLGGI